MLYMIGLGLCDEEDVTLKGLKVIKKCDRVYLEAYTSILTVGKEKLEELYGREIILADREMVESNADEILKEADVKDVAFLVVGAPFSATTHGDLESRAEEKNIKVEIIENASIINAVARVGLDIYSYGKVISIPFWTESWQPDSFFDKIIENYKIGAHTLCLLDIKVKEPTLDSILKKKKVYMPPKFMTVAEAADQLVQIIEKRRVDGADNLLLNPSNLAIGLARVGSGDQQIVACSLSEMRDVNLGPPLHSLIIPGNTLQTHESKKLLRYALNSSVTLNTELPT